MSEVSGRQDLQPLQATAWKPTAHAPAGALCQPAARAAGAADALEARARARKRELLVRRLAGDGATKSTVHAVLDRRGPPRHRARGTPLSPTAPNALWCTDFKGEFKLGNGQYCYPLTVTDQASRFLLLCEALESTKEIGALEAFQHLFRERGLPAAIRSDNGLPFASPNGLYNLSKLSVWWLRLGIAIERIQPGQPQQNGRHERMHLTLKRETTGVEAERRGSCSRGGVPAHDREVLVTSCGRICMHRKKVNISTVMAGQRPARPARQRHLGLATR